MTVHDSLCPGIYGMAPAAYHWCTPGVTIGVPAEGLRLVFCSASDVVEDQLVALVRSLKAALGTVRPKANGSSALRTLSPDYVGTSTSPEAELQGIQQVSCGGSLAPSPSFVLLSRLCGDQWFSGSRVAGVQQVSRRGILNKRLIPHPCVSYSPHPEYVGSSVG